MCRFENYPQVRKFSGPSPSARPCSARPPATLSVTINVPVRAPFTAGTKVTEIVQLIEADKIAGLGERR